MRHLLSVLCLSSALAMSVAAHADTAYTYNFSGTGISGMGTTTIAATGTDGVYDVTSISGTVNGINITGILPVNSYEGNDNLFYGSDPYLDPSGVSFLLDDGANVRIFNVNSDYFFEGDGQFVLDGGGIQPELRPAFRSAGAGGETLPLDTFSFAPASVVTPEPSSFMLLGTGILGAAGMVRRRLVRR